MSYQSVDHELETKPKIGSIMHFHNATIKISKEFSYTDTVLFGRLGPQFKLKPHKNEAGYVAYIKETDFIVSKKLEKEAKKIFMTYNKYCTFELERLNKLINKKTKTCSCCKTIHPITESSILYKKINERIKHLERIIKENLETDYKKMAIVNFFLPFESTRCSSCKKSNFLLTESSILKQNILEQKIIKMNKDFIKVRNKDAEKQSKKLNIKIYYYVRGLIHESDVNHWL